MIFSKCPRCGSDRIRRGYRNTRIWSKLVGRYNLLCNACNWEFIGFAIPGTLESHSAKRRKKRQEQKNQQPTDVLAESNNAPEDFQEPEVEEVDKSPHKIKVRKRVRVKLKK